MYPLPLTRMSVPSIQAMPCCPKMKSVAPWMKLLPKKCLPSLERRVSWYP